MKFIAALCVSATLAISANIARADEGAEKTDPAGEVAGPAKEKPSLGKAGTWYTFGHVAADPDVGVGWFPVKDFTVAAALGFTYNSNGSAITPIMGVKGIPANKVGADLVLAAIYFVVDKFPVAMGPELILITSLSPAGVGATYIVEPMWALRYAPFPAPIAIGTDLGLAIAQPQSPGKTAVSLATSGLQIIYAF